jgi:ABC-type uncharacterized transport system substrate-binding protein
MKPQLAALAATVLALGACSDTPTATRTNVRREPTLIAAAAAEWAAAVTRRARELGVLVSAGTDGQGAETEGSLPNLHVELDRAHGRTFA